MYDGININKIIYIATINMDDETCSVDKQKVAKKKNGIITTDEGEEYKEDIAWECINWEGKPGDHRFLFKTKADMCSGLHMMIIGKFISDYSNEVIPV